MYYSLTDFVELTLQQFLISIPLLQYLYFLFACRCILLVYMIHKRVDEAYYVTLGNDRVFLEIQTQSRCKNVTVVCQNSKRMNNRNMLPVGSSSTFRGLPQTTSLMFNYFPFFCCVW